jgi:hypothetical protein
MATGTKETRKVWESLPLEMEAEKKENGKKRKCTGKKSKKTAEAATEAVSTTGKGRMVGKVSEKEKMSEKKQGKKTTAADSSRGQGRQQQQQQQGGGSEGGWGGFRWGHQMGLADGLFRGFGRMIWSDGFRQQQQQQW